MAYKHFMSGRLIAPGKPPSYLMSCGTVSIQAPSTSAIYGKLHKLGALCVGVWFVQTLRMNNSLLMTKITKRLCDGSITEQLRDAYLRKAEAYCL